MTVVNKPQIALAYTSLIQVLRQTANWYQSIFHMTVPRYCNGMFDRLNIIYSFIFIYHH